MGEWPRFSKQLEPKLVAELQLEAETVSVSKLRKFGLILGAQGASGHRFLPRQHPRLAGAGACSRHVAPSRVPMDAENAVRAWLEGSACGGIVPGFPGNAEVPAMSLSVLTTGF